MRGLGNRCVNEAKTPKQMIFFVFTASLKFVEKIRNSTDLERPLEPRTHLWLHGMSQDQKNS